MEIKKIALAYSGGLDTSVAIKWLSEKYGSKIVTVTVDVGQEEDFRAIGEKALNVGAENHYTVDAKEEFIREYVFPSIKANGLYQGKYPVSTALSRPLIARKLMDIAHREGCDAVAHGCTGKGNDQLRIEISCRALDPTMKILAPTREWGMSRDQEVEYAMKHGIPVSQAAKKYSIDQNLWGGPSRAVRSRILGTAQKRMVGSGRPRRSAHLTSQPSSSLSSGKASR